MAPPCDAQVKVYLIGRAKADCVEARRKKYDERYSATASQPQGIAAAKMQMD